MNEQCGDCKAHVRHATKTSNFVAHRQLSIFHHHIIAKQKWFLVTQTTTSVVIVMLC